MLIATGCRNKRETAHELLGGIPCPVSLTEPGLTQIHVVDDDAIRLNASSSLRWIAADDNVYELGADPLRPTLLGNASDIVNDASDERYLYRKVCVGECADDTYFNGIDRIDRGSGEVVNLVNCQCDIGAIAPHGEHVYWGGVNGHAKYGIQVHRVPKVGGMVEELRFEASSYFEGSLADDRRNVRALVPSATGLLVVGGESLLWIPRYSAAGNPRTILRVEYSIGDVVLDGDSVYVADRGKAYQYSPASGWILRIPLAGGPPLRLAGPLRWPTAIASYGSNVYFMLEESTDIWSVPKAGGVVEAVARNGPMRAPCDVSRGLWAGPRGLTWTRGGGIRENIYFAPWSALESKPELATKQISF